MRYLNLLLVIVLVLEIGNGCKQETIQSRISDELGIYVTEETVLSHEDDHGGFHGDGTLIAALLISDEAAVGKIRESWKPLPLNDNLTRLNEKFRTGAESTLFPYVENGYYCFIDRHHEAIDPNDDSSVHSRCSYNFTFAIFDTDTNTLYYAEIDT